MKFEIPKEVEYVLERLRGSGHEAYLVGGCVRDFVMGVEPKDYDVTTDATPDEVHSVFENHSSSEIIDEDASIHESEIRSEPFDVHLIDTGIKQGTVTVIKNHIPVEVTTYRTESTYSDGRHPDDVRFSKSIEEDLARRDFTMNAIAYSPCQRHACSDIIADANTDAKDNIDAEVNIDRKDSAYTDVDTDTKDNIDANANTDKRDNIDAEVNFDRKDSAYTDMNIDTKDNIDANVNIERKNNAYADVNIDTKDNIDANVNFDRKDNVYGRFVDPYKGMVDIKNQTIRCVGDPVERFTEDALRIIRALRFSSVLGFEIEDDSKQAIFAEKERLDNISRERIQKELQLLLCGKDAERVLRDYAEIIAKIIPEIVPMFDFDQCTPYHIYDVWEHTLKVIANTPPDPVIRFAALFHDIGKPSTFSKDENGVGHFYGHPEVSHEMTERIMRRLKFDNVTRNEVLTLVRWHDLRPEPTDKSVRKVIVRVSPELFDKWIEIKRADNKGQAPHLTERQEFITEIAEVGHRLIESEGELSLKTLNIKGKDLIELGLAEGPLLGQVLDELLNDVLEERIPNEHVALMEAAQVIIARLQ